MGAFGGTLNAISVSTCPLVSMPWPPGEPAPFPCPRRLQLIRITEQQMLFVGLAIWQTELHLDPLQIISRDCLNLCQRHFCHQLSPP